MKILSDPPVGNESTLICKVCGSSFTRPPNLAVKAKVCTSVGQSHKTTFKKQLDGSTKKISCGCCACVYKKTLAKNRSLDGKLIPTDRVQEFLDRTKERYGQAVFLAFRLGINAMLRVTEMATLEAVDIVADAKPLAQIHIKALKKKVQMVYKVDLDPKTAQDLLDFLGPRRDGNLFGLPVRTLQHKFKQVIRSMGLKHLSIHALRHTGISLRAGKCETMDELNYVRNQARHESIETTRLYVGFEEKQRVEMAKRVKWV